MKRNAAPTVSRKHHGKFPSKLPCKRACKTRSEMHIDIIIMFRPCPYLDANDTYSPNGNCNCGACHPMATSVRIHRHRISDLEVVFFTQDPHGWVQDIRNSLQDVVILFRISPGFHIMVTIAHSQIACMTSNLCDWIR